MKITLGKGLKNSLGFRFSVEHPDDLLQKFATDEPVDEAWWSPHVFEEDRRRARSWIGSQTIAVDVDAHGEDGKKVEVLPWIETIEEGFGHGVLPGSALHPTPHGFRLLFLFVDECSDRDEYLEAVEGALRLTKEGIAALGLDDEVDLHVDAPVSRDLARLFWHPSSIVDGVTRTARIIPGETDEGEVILYTPSSLATSAPPAPPPPPPPPPSLDLPRPPEAPPPPVVDEYDEAVRLWLEAHPEASRRVDQGISTGVCPACGHRECFRAFAVDDVPVPGRWVCYSTDHGTTASACGKDRGACFVGDPLDLAAFLAERHPLGLLVDGGFLPDPDPVSVEAPAAGPGETNVFVPRAEPFEVSPLEAAEATLAALPPGTLYRFGPEVGTLRRTPDGLLTHRATNRRGAILEALRSGVVFFDHRYHSASKTFVPVKTVPKVDLGDYTLEAAQTHPSVRALRGVYTSPVYAGNLERIVPGWNASTGIFFDEPKDLEGLRPALHLTKDQTRPALDEYLEDFRDAIALEDLGNAVGLIVTLLVRPAIVGPVPLHFALATTEGSGKTTLVDTFAGGLVCGEPPAHLRQTRDENEFAKTIFAFARRGTNHLCLDNVSGGAELDSPVLAELVTASTIEARVLGVSDVQRFPNDFVLTATGNNVSLSPEVLRRTVPIRFEPRKALKDRRFVHPDPIGWVRQKRKALLEILIGAVERWKVAGKPPHPSGRTMPGFPEWSHVVGGIVGLLGFDEWLEDLERFHEQGSEWDHAARAFLATWFGDISTPNEARVSDLFPLIADDPAGLGINAHTDHGMKTALGQQIRKMEGRPSLLPYRVEALRRSSVARRYRVTKEV